jgi:hypothetical protein
MVLPLLDEEVLRMPMLSKTFFSLLFNVSKATSIVFTVMEGPMSEKVVQCLYWAIGGASGVEPTKLALRTIKVICSLFEKSADEIKQGRFVHAFVSILSGVSLSFAKFIHEMEFMFNTNGF